MQAQKLFSIRTLWIILSSMIGCLILGTTLAPKLINWYASPFLPQGASGISCAPSIDWAMEKYLFFQLTSLLIGVISGILIAWLLRKKVA
jgi:hypothetical protein